MKLTKTTVYLLVFLSFFPACRTTPVDEADAERRQFILSAVRQLAKRDMEVKSVELGYTPSWTLQFIAAEQKLVVGEPPTFSPTERVERQRHFKAFMETVTHFQKHDLDVREFDFSPREPRTIKFSGGKLVIGPSPTPEPSVRGRNP